VSHSEVDVVIPTWNGRELLRRCLPTLEAQTERCRVIVVDNGSVDGTRELLSDEHTDVELVGLDRNHGFGPAVNRGSAFGEAPYVVLVNNDVECDPGFVEEIVEPLRASPTIGMVAGLLLRPGRAVIDSFGLEVDRTLSAFPRFAGADCASTELHERHLLGPSGGAAAYRREAFEAIGGFDEALFAYMEDVDLALRLRAAGWMAAGAPGAIGVHLGSATFGARSRWQVETAGWARAYLIRKYGILRGNLGVAGWTIVVEAGVATAELVIGRDLAAIRGRRAGWRAARGKRATVPRGVINTDLRFFDSLRRRAAVLERDGSGPR
jgi:N-acetylglucosaminyl-diphospho-decaprenol L-rhamnosyltransferase